ncbi:MAG TPA: N-acyl homoserine lactonase family protein [Thermoleophilaceae bacterium]|jgi:glyoxylase-like metal-dependent hydrolase (beta-lactamase superfamily II)
MATGAEPRRAELPLPGGREGAAVRVRPLLCGTATWPTAWPHREEGRLAGAKALGLWPGSRSVVLPIVAYLVEHPAAGPILVDTGLHPSIAVDPKQNLGRFHASTSMRTVRMEPQQAVAEQLRSAGIEPSAVKLVVMTHLHYDHASAMSEFPGATFVFTRQEWEAATEPRALFQGYVRSNFDHAFDYRLLEFEGEEVGSFASFGRAFDLLGDGSVRVAFTPGHTAGHMSVVLRTRSREVLAIGDAAYTEHTLSTSHLPYRMHDEHNFRRSLREIQRYAEQTPSALLVPGHDMEAWERLDPVYE